MDTFIKILLIIYLIIWIAIGSLFIAGGAAIITLAGKYGFALAGLVGNGGTVMEALGGLVGGDAARMLADPKERAALYKTFSAKQKNCLEQAVGAEEVRRALTEKNYQPRSDLLLKASGCFQ